MSYTKRRRSVHGLGQLKFVPGQVNFRDPFGPALGPGYIEHGSWMTGEPDIVQFGYDPYRGLMGLGQGFLTSTLCDPTTTSQVAAARITSALNAGAQAALVGGAIAGVIGSMVGKRVMNPLASAAAGALVGWGANLVWTATHRAAT